MKDRRQEDYTLQASDPLFLQIKFLKIQDIFKLRLLKFIFNCLNKMNPLIFWTWFTLTSQVHRYQTRSQFIHFDSHTHTRTLFIHTARTTHYGLKLTRVLGAKLWNSLPPNIRISDQWRYIRTKSKIIYFPITTPCKGIYQDVSTVILFHHYYYY